jgi:hypothetical protein
LGAVADHEAAAAEDAKILSTKEPAKREILIVPAGIV